MTLSKGLWLINTLGLTLLIQAFEVNAAFSVVNVTGISIGEGNFDPAPTVGPDQTLWMSYSRVTTAPAGNLHVETRLATSLDQGFNWQDQGISVNTPTTLPLPPPFDVNAVTHEISRLIYNPFALGENTDPWIILWHRYLSIYDGTDTVRLFQHGWIGMKSGASPLGLNNERKLFTGNFYDPVNNNDAFGTPQYPLDTDYPAELGACLSFTEPGIIAKANGLYVSLVCAEGAGNGKTILMHCDHAMNGCQYRGSFLNNTEANQLDASFQGFSASELVTVDFIDYLIVTPVSAILPGNIYRGCLVFEIADLHSAELQRKDNLPIVVAALEPSGDFNGACGYHEALKGSGIIMGEAFFQGSLTFRMFATELQILPQKNVPISGFWLLIFAAIIIATQYRARTIAN